MAPKLSTALLLLPVALAFDLIPRHEGDHGDHASGDGHDHSMSNGRFNFTASDIPWPVCAQDCLDTYFEYFPEPVNHPLCVSEDFYNNVTTCVATSCTEYEQGAYAVVAEIECPEDEDFEVDFDRDDVVEDLKEQGGNPQECEAVDDEMIRCENETSPNQGVRGAGQGGLLCSTFVIAVLASVLTFSL